MPPAPELPVEIIQKIVAHIYDDLPKQAADSLNSSEKPLLHHTSIKTVLALRLLNKVWAVAVPPFIYHNLYLRTPWINRYLNRMCEDGFDRVDFSNLRYLYLDQVLYIPELDSQHIQRDLSNEHRQQLELGYRYREPGSILLPDAASIINLCGAGLHTLKFKFTHAVGFSGKMIDAIKNIESLKTLIIKGIKVGQIPNDTTSIAAVLNDTISLESLSLRLATVETLNLKAGALPNLIHLWISLHSNNLLTYYDFISSKDRNIRFLECFPGWEPRNMTAMVYPLRRTVTGLLFEIIPDHILMTLAGVVLPKLRVIRSIHITAKPRRPIWFEWSIFKTVEVFIANYSSSRDYWEHALKQLESFKKAPKLKHFIFITHDPKVQQDSILVELFKAAGITCYFKAEMTHIDILEFVNRLDEVSDKINALKH